MAFSAAVKISDANDFLAPAQACVVGISGDKKASLALGTAAIVGDFAAGSVAIHGKESDFSQVRNLRWPYFRVVYSGRLYLMYWKGRPTCGPAVNVKADLPVIILGMHPGVCDRRQHCGEGDAE